MPRPDIWGEVKDLLEKGGTPKIVLTPAMQIVKPKYRGKKGRPRIHPPGNRYSVGYLLTPGGSRMTCQNLGCNKKLRVRPKSIVCSEKCERELKQWCEMVLKVINGELSPWEFPVDLRLKRNTTRGTRKRTVADTERMLGIKCKVPGYYARLAKDVGIPYGTVYRKVAKLGWSEDQVRAYAEKRKRTKI